MKNKLQVFIKHIKTMLYNLWLCVSLKKDTTKNNLSEKEKIGKFEENKEGMPKEMREHIDNFRRFEEKSKIVKYITDLFDLDENNLKGRVLLLFEVEKQRTYLLKTNDEFFIINDNRGDIRVVLRSPMEKLKYIINSNKDYELKFEYFKQSLKISRSFFHSKEFLRDKIDNL